MQPDHSKENIHKQAPVDYIREELPNKFIMRVMIFIIFANLLLIASTYGQLVSVANVQIYSNALITIKGDMLAEMGAQFSNNGNLEVSGDFTNNSGANLFGTSNGEVTFNGGTQNISGTSITLFNDLTLTGSGTIQLQQDIITGGAGNTGLLSLNNQILKLNTHELTIASSSSGAITRGSGYIVAETDPMTGYGTITWLIGNSTGYFEFPFGNDLSGVALPAVMNITTPGDAVSGKVSISTYPTVTTGTPNNLPLPTGLTSLLNLAGFDNSSNVVDRWWVIDVENYGSRPVSDITLTYRDSEWNTSGGSTNTINESALKAQSSDGMTWTPTPSGMVNTTSNTVTVSGINNYKPFWTLLGNTDPLPITLISFEAKEKNNKEVMLEWITATEINNDYFTIERSKDGFEFEPLMYIDGAGNSTSTLYYHETDNDPFSGLSYYRLKQTDYDGNYSYSDIKAVRINNEVAASLQVYPNPASTFIKVVADPSISYVQLVDLSGKLISELRPETQYADGVYVFDCGSLPSGIYFVRTSEGITQKVVVQN